MKTLRIASVACAALIMSGLVAEARGFHGGGGFRGGGFHAGGFRGGRVGGVRGYRGPVAGGYRGRYGAVRPLRRGRPLRVWIWPLPIRCPAVTATAWARLPSERGRCRLRRHLRPLRTLRLLRCLCGRLPSVLMPVRQGRGARPRPPDHPAELAARSGRLASEWVRSNAMISRIVAPLLLATCLMRSPRWHKPSGLEQPAALFHGNYCGLGNNAPLPPIDALDAACARHDACTPLGWVAFTRLQSAASVDDGPHRARSAAAGRYPRAGGLHVRRGRPSAVRPECVGFSQGPGLRTLRRSPTAPYRPVYRAY